MTLALIVAMTRARVIGRDGGLPWHIPADLKRFRSLTLDHPLIVGRRTYDSIGRPLPRRRMVVLTRQAGYQPAGVEVVPSLEAALALLADAETVFVGGGAAVYAEALPRADALYLSRVDAEVAGDVYFPPFDPAGWAVASRQACPADESNPVGHTFFHLVRPRPDDPPADLEIV